MVFLCSEMLIAPIMWIVKSVFVEMASCGDATNSDSPWRDYFQILVRVTLVTRTLRFDTYPREDASICVI